MIDLPNILNDLYKIPVDSIDRIPFGYTNQNYTILSGNDRYVARISSSSKIEQLKFELYVLNQLKNYNLGFYTPTPLKTKFNTDFVVLDGGDKVLTVFHYIPGNRASELWKYPFTLKKFSWDFGMKVGKLHSAFSGIGVPNGMKPRTHEQLIHEYLDKFQHYKFLFKKQRCGNESVKSNKWLKLLVDKIQLPVDESIKYLNYFTSLGERRITHTDLRLENILAKNENITAILDFDEIVLSDFAYDISKILVEVYSDKKHVVKNIKDLIDIDGFLSFLRPYIKTRGKRKKEFLYRVIDLLNLPALHVLSIVGRDPDFDENERIKNILWYTNFITIMKGENNTDWLKSNLLR
jgi:Ser/Thr protein kinase RdoA (MazF antagonist)